MLLSGCVSTASNPIILTNSQFTCLDKPPVPPAVDIGSREGQILTGNYITRMELVVDDCKGQLLEVRDVIQVQGGTVTDTLVEEKRRGFLGLF